MRRRLIIILIFLAFPLSILMGRQKQVVEFWQWREGTVAKTHFNIELSAFQRRMVLSAMKAGSGITDASLEQTPHGTLLTCKGSDTALSKAVSVFRKVLRVNTHKNPTDQKQPLARGPRPRAFLKPP